MTAIEQHEDIVTIQERMFEFAAEGWSGISVGYGVSLGNMLYGNIDKPRDCSYYLAGHTPDKYVVLDVPEQVKLARHKFGRSLIVHTFVPANDQDRLFPILDAEEDFKVTTIVMDDMSDVVLKAIHDAHIPQDRNSRRDDAMCNYAITLGIEDNEDKHRTSLSDLSWKEGTSDDLRTADSLIATMMRTMRLEQSRWSPQARNPQKIYGGSSPNL